MSRYEFRSISKVNDMQKIMIVDDEAIFRDYLRQAIPWGDYDFEICCEAKNGVEALELMPIHLPDIALVDINMPFMDGLQLTEQLKARYPRMGVVLITGHSEFEYARKAVRLGVEDYILKPFSKEELILTMLKLQKSIIEAQEVSLTLKDNLALLKEGILNQLIGSDYNDKDEITERKLEGIGFTPYSKCFQVTCIEIDNLDQKWNKASEKLLWKYAVTNILNELMEISGNHYVFNGPEGRIICILEFERENEERKSYLEGYAQLCALIKKYLKFTVTIGVSSKKSGYKTIRASYLEALEALQQKFILGNDRLIEYGQQLNNTVTSGFISMETSEQLLIHLRMGEWEALHIKLNLIFEQIRQQRLSIDYTYVICMGLVSLCLSYVTEKGHPIEDCFGEDFFPYNEIMKHESIEAVQQWIIALFQLSIQYTKLHKPTKSNKMALAAKLYIEQHYSDPELQLEEVAKHVFVNSSYLRALFKKEIGMTLTDYVTHVRMQKAKELLSRGSSKLADIAEQIGYNDPAYFSRCFKKYYGSSPSEYENSKK
ncbi:response regulator [Paenibacillus psychroresistens]|uniref:Response regulator n=1 Tax=Paenibacillus psychroresistens TaxID=1778678 RepID=A0A6B8RV45_9BACL|nr:response regulator [Paenibacillus psychroresistens]QGQ99018.1 response regulator [Paenibacillus psychroresistens]